MVVPSYRVCKTTAMVLVCAGFRDRIGVDPCILCRLPRLLSIDIRPNLRDTYDGLYGESTVECMGFTGRSKGSTTKAAVIRAGPETAKLSSGITILRT